MVPSHVKDSKKSRGLEGLSWILKKAKRQWVSTIKKIVLVSNSSKFQQNFSTIDVWYSRHYSIDVTIDVNEDVNVLRSACTGQTHRKLKEPNMNVIYDDVNELCW